MNETQVCPSYNYNIFIEFQKLPRECGPALKINSTEASKVKGERPPSYIPSFSFEKIIIDNSVLVLLDLSLWSYKSIHNVYGFLSPAEKGRPLDFLLSF